MTCTQPTKRIVIPQTTRAAFSVFSHSYQGNSSYSACTYASTAAIPNNTQVEATATDVFISLKREGEPNETHNE